MTNEVLGHIRCTECDGLANVMQATRRGAHLYVRCAESPSCGMLQPTGIRPQTRWFYQTQWIDGPPPRPGNVAEGGEFVPDLPGEPERVAEGVPKPIEDYQPEPEIEDEPERSGGGVVRWVGLALVSAVSIAALWRVA